MKPLVAKQYPYTGDYYGYAVIANPNNPDETTRQYVTTPTQVAMALSINLLGDLVIDSESKFQIDSYLKNVVDRNGEQIYTDGVWQVFQTAPLLSGLGTKEGYRYRARLVEGQI